MKIRSIRFVTLLAAVLLIAASAWAQESGDGPSRAELRLVELESKVSYNEALHSYYDLALIHQVVEGHGETAEERVRWLTRHSRCVSGRLTQDQARERPGNCRWTRNLHPDGRRPRGWDRVLHGRWSRARDPWIAHVPRVREFVYGRDDYRPCAETPQTWDGVRYGRACIERGEDCPSVMSRSAATRRSHSPSRVLDCAVPYVSSPAEEGLHNFAVTSAPAPLSLPSDSQPSPNAT